ncbi:MAG: TylF/MycF/NovP-related O-methyltransferase [Limisphaerales bacterium]
MERPTKELIQAASAHSFVDEERMVSLTQLAERMNRTAVPGDFVECGCYKGGTAAILSRYMGPSRHLWLYDSFAGMPSTCEKDGTEAIKYVGEGACSPTEVHSIMRIVGTGEQSYTIHQGWFQDTFKKNIPPQVALLHCDCDWYESVTLVLETFYPVIPKGGCVVLDDFGYWEGCREAFYDFCDRTGEKPLLERVGTSQAHWIKGITHNR